MLKKDKNIEIKRRRIEVIETFENLWTIVGKQNEDTEEINKGDGWRYWNKGTQNGSCRNPL